MNTMTPRTAQDLDQMSREALKAGRLESLAQPNFIVSVCHPQAGLRITRAYESEVIRLTCGTCEVFVADIKVASE